MSDDFVQKKKKKPTPKHPKIFLPLFPDGGWHSQVPSSRGASFLLGLAGDPPTAGAQGPCPARPVRSGRNRPFTWQMPGLSWVRFLLLWPPVPLEQVQVLFQDLGGSWGLRSDKPRCHLCPARRARGNRHVRRGPTMCCMHTVFSSASQVSARFFPRRKRGLGVQDHSPVGAGT